MTTNVHDEDNFDAVTEHFRRREWNCGPLKDLFPRIEAPALESILDICISKNFTYNLSVSKHHNTRRFTSIVVAHVRHKYTDYEKMLREEHVERYEARRRTAPDIWKVLRKWCPWDEANDQLERCLQATLMRPEERGLDWDPMDIDADSEFEGDPMEID